MTYLAKTSRLDREGVIERSDQLAVNRTQNRVDNYSFVGAMAGAVGGLLLRKSFIGLLGGSTLGIAAGVLIHVSVSLGAELKRRIFIIFYGTQ